MEGHDSLWRGVPNLGSPRAGGYLVPDTSSVEKVVKVAAVDSRFIQLANQAEPLVVEILVRGGNPRRTAEQAFHLFRHSHEHVAFGKNKAIGYVSRIVSLLIAQLAKATVLIE